MTRWLDIGLGALLLCTACPGPSAPLTARELSREAHASTDLSMDSDEGQRLLTLEATLVGEAYRIDGVALSVDLTVERREIDAQTVELRVLAFDENGAGQGSARVFDADNNEMFVTAPQHQLSCELEHRSYVCTGAVRIELRLLAGETAELSIDADASILMTGLGIVDEPEARLQVNLVDPLAGI